MPLYLHKSLFGDKILTPTSVQIFGYGESPVATQERALLRFILVIDNSHRWRLVK